VIITLLFDRLVFEQLYPDHFIGFGYRLSAACSDSGFEGSFDMPLAKALTDLPVDLSAQIL